MIQKIDKLCRICGKADTQLIPIFSDDGLVHDLRGKIEKHLFSIHVSKDDNLPQQLCYQCTSSLIIWSDLFELSIEVEKNLSNELNKLTIEKKAHEKSEGSNTLKRVVVKKGSDSIQKKIGKDEIDESVTEDIFKEIDDFDHFLNQSPTSSMETDSDHDAAEDIASGSKEVQDRTSIAEESVPSKLSRKREKTQKNNTTSGIPVELSPNRNPRANILKKPKQTHLKPVTDNDSHSQPVETTNPTVSELGTLVTQPSEITHSITTDSESDTIENLESTGLNSDESFALADASNSEITNPLIDSVQQKKKHPPRRKKGSPENVESIVCHICGKFFKGMETMRIHVKTVHSTERPHVCGLCNTAFKRKDHLDCHIKYKHENNTYPKRPPKEGVTAAQKRLCVHCGKILSSSQVLKEHINSFHSGNRPYKCEQCHISFSRYSSFYHHTVVRNHKISSFSKTCDLCGLYFQSESFYFKHMWKHPENVFCEICNITFTDNDSFRKHIETSHEEEKSFQCSSCGKRFGTKSSLKLHVRVHSGEKPYECQYCSWKFHKKGQLVVHIYRHTGERPYVCDICDRGFKQKGDMRKHKAGHIMQLKKTRSSSCTS